MRRRPVIHFFALGALLAVGRAAWFRMGPEEPPVIAVTAAVVEALAPLDPARLERWIDDEVLYREGLARGLAWNPAMIARRLQVGRFVGGELEADDTAVLDHVAQLGLDRDDPVERQQVVARMRLRLQAGARRRPPTEAQLQAYADAHAERFVRPARVSFTHVFVRRDHGDDPAATARRLADRLRADAPSGARATAWGDVFRAGNHSDAYAPSEIARVLGDDVAEQLQTLPLGLWSAPVRSPYGWHLLRVARRSAETHPPLAAIREQVQREWRLAEARAAVVTAVRELRARYRIEFDPAAQARIAAAAQGRG